MADRRSEIWELCSRASDAAGDARDVMLVLKHFFSAEATALTAEERDACATVLRLGIAQAEEAQAAIETGMALTGGARG